MAPTTRQEVRLSARVTRNNSCNSPPKPKVFSQGKKKKKSIPIVRSGRGGVKVEPKPAPAPKNFKAKVTVPPAQPEASDIDYKMFQLENKVHEVTKYFKTSYINDECIRAIATRYWISEPSTSETKRPKTFVPTGKWIKDFREKYNMVKSSAEAKDIVGRILFEFNPPMPVFTERGLQKYNLRATIGRQLREAVKGGVKISDIKTEVKCKASPAKRGLMNSPKGSSPRPSSVPREHLVEGNPFYQKWRDSKQFLKVEPTDYEPWEEPDALERALMGNAESIIVKPEQWVCNPLGPTRFINVPVKVVAPVQDSNSVELSRSQDQEALEYHDMRGSGSMDQEHEQVNTATEQRIVKEDPGVEAASIGNISVEPVVHVESAAPAAIASSILEDLEMIDELVASLIQRENEEKAQRLAAEQSDQSVLTSTQAPDILAASQIVILQCTCCTCRCPCHGVKN